jgi:hypothetical protein
MTTRATLKFLAPGSSAPIYRASVGGAEARLDLTGSYEEREVEISDGRALAQRPALDTHGFAIVRLTAAVADIDAPEQRAVHDAECRRLVAAATGAARAHVFDHTRRSSDPARREAKKQREPAAVTHNDYTPRSAPQRVRDLMGDEAAALLARPFAIVNVWRPLVPVEQYPLALCDARTLDDAALVPSERRSKDRLGEIYMLRFDARQRWIYFPRMTTSEALLIKTFDSRTDGRARWCAHTAFADPQTGPAARPRESIETRVFAFFGAYRSRA